MTQDINSPGYEVPPELQGQVAITTLDKIYNWGRRSSLWPLMFGLACCAIEMICTATFWYGNNAAKPTPKRCDDCLRHRHKENDPANRASLQPNAGA